MPIRLVLALPLLVLHDAALLIQFLLVDGADEVPHAIRLEPQRQIERAHRHVLVIVRTVEPRGAVHLGGAGRLERAEELVVEVLRAIEHEVLEQMREAGAARPLVLAAHVVPHVHGDDRRLVVLVHDHGEPVRQNEFLIGDVDVGQIVRERKARQQRQR